MINHKTVIPSNYDGNGDAHVTVVDHGEEYELTSEPDVDVEVGIKQAYYQVVIDVVDIDKYPWLQHDSRVEIDISQSSIANFKGSGIVYLAKVEYEQDGSNPCRAVVRIPRYEVEWASQDD